MRKKNTIIKRIKTIIEQDGEFKDTDVNVTPETFKHHTQTLGTFKFVQFTKEGVDVEFYTKAGVLTDEDVVPYENLDGETLEIIERLAEEWSAICYKTMKRASD